MPFAPSTGSASHPNLHDGKLPPCPPSPNCVCSDQRDSEHQVLPFVLLASAGKAWEAARQAVMQLPRTRIVAEGPGYLHAECRSALFRFVDDLQLQLREQEGIIAVRSASRLGRSDFGVNRRRVETLRAALAAKKAIG